MSTGATVALVVGVGGAVYLLVRSRSQQQQALAGAAAATAGATPASGGGVTGILGRLWGTWKADPLGINQHKQAFNDTLGVVKTGANQVVGVFSDIGSFVKGIF